MKISPIAFFRNSNVKYKNTITSSDNNSKSNSQANSKNGEEAFSAHLNALQSYQIPFCSNKIPVYIYPVDGSLKPKRYDSLEDTSEAGISLSGASDCVTGKYISTNSYYVIKAEDVETKDENKKPQLDQEKFDKAIKMLKKREAMSLRAIYIVNTEDIENRKRYDSIQDAIDAKGFVRARIRKCLSGDSPSTNGYYIIDAKKIETEDEEGDFQFDREKFDEAIDEIKNLESLRFLPLYVVDEENPDKITRFDGRIQAAKELGILQNSISACIKDKKLRSRGLAFIDAREVEVQKEDGTYELDMDKYKEALRLLKVARVESKPGNKNAVYTFDEFEKWSRFDSVTEASKELEIPRNSINFSIQGKPEVTNGHIFFYAQNFEEIDEEGNLKPNEAKLQKMAKKARIKILKVKAGCDKAVYHISKKCPLKRYDSMRQASQATGIYDKGIAKAIKTKTPTASGDVFVKAECVEMVQKDKVVLNKTKMQELLDEIMPDTFTIVEPKKRIPPTEEEIKRIGTVYAIKGMKDLTFKNIEVAAHELNIDIADLFAHLKGKDVPLNGWLFSCDLYY